MTIIHNEDLTLRVSESVDRALWDEARYDAFVDELCGDREYQKSAIFAAMRFLAGGKYADLRALARENCDANEKLREFYGGWREMERRLHFPDKLSCSLDLATGTGKSYVLYGLAAILMAEGAIDRVLVLCPSTTIEDGLLRKFKDLATNSDLRALMPDGAKILAPRIISASETIAPGCMCVENYHAVLKHVRSSISDSLRGAGGRALVLNDEAHHVTSGSQTDATKWKEFLQDTEFGFRRIVGVSGTCYNGDDYFADVVSRYSLRQAIEDGVVKNVEYVVEAPELRETREKWQVIHQRHQKNKRKLRRHGIRPLTILVTKNTALCKQVAEDLREFLTGHEGITAEQAADKILPVTSLQEHKANVARLRSVDNWEGKVEWILSVAMLNEGWDVKNVFQIVPHEERAFNSKLLISQVLGRGLRIPERLSQLDAVVTVFNHVAWGPRIEHLVEEVLEREMRVSSLIVPDSPYNFTLHNLDYTKERSERQFKQEGEFRLFQDGYMDLPNHLAEESVEVDYERVRGGTRSEEYEIRHPTLTAGEIANEMWQRLRHIDEETAEEKDPKHRTNYARKHSRQWLEGVVNESVKRARIDPERIPERARQRLLTGLNVLGRRISKRVTYELSVRALETLNTRDRRADSCSASDFRRDKFIFYSENCADSLPPEQRDFFAQVTDPIGEFRAAMEIRNSHDFKTPLNLVVADSGPEKKFIRELVRPRRADVVDGWLKSTASLFYEIEYAWGKPDHRTRRVSHTKRAKFNPDFFIKQGDFVCVVEIKGDEEIQDPSQENIAKRRFAVEHFRRLNERLKSEGCPVRYHFTMLTPRDYPAFFERLESKDVAGFMSELDVEAQDRQNGNGNGNSGNE